MSDTNDTRNDELARKRDEKRLQALAQRALDDSIQQLDAQTLAALAEARQQALAVTRTRRKKGGTVAATGAIAAAVLLAVVWQQNSGTISDAELAEHARYLELSEGVLQTEEVWQVDEELLDDMEFYAWLAEQELQQLEQSHAG